MSVLAIQMSYFYIQSSSFLTAGQSKISGDMQILTMQLTKAPQCYYPSAAAGAIWKFSQVINYNEKVLNVLKTAYFFSTYILEVFFFLCVSVTLTCVMFILGL